MTETCAPAPTDRPAVLTIAGSDSGGGAGVQADLKTIEAIGGFGTSAVTAVTAQNTTGVESTHVLPTAEIEAQIEAVLGDFDVRAIKTGMLATAEIVEAVAETVSAVDCPVVVDPVMVAESGDRLLTEAAESAYDDLLAEATLATPNADEAAVLTGIEPEGEADARAAGDELVSAGAEAALVTGGHVAGATVRDVLVRPEGTETIEHPRVETEATHGSGCTLSAAIATRLARGDGLAAAVEESVAFMQRAVRYHHAVGEGSGAVQHLVGLRDEAARDATRELVLDAVDRLAAVDADVVPAGGTVAAATPCAESLDDVAAVDGGIERREDGLETAGRVRFGASERLGRALLGARGDDPTVRIGLDCLREPTGSEAVTHIDSEGEGVLVGPDVDSVLEALRRPGEGDS